MKGLGKKISEAPTGYVGLRLLCMQVWALECEQLFPPDWASTSTFPEPQQRHIEIFDMRPTPRFGGHQGKV